MRLHTLLASSEQRSICPGYFWRGRSSAFSTIILARASKASRLPCDDVQRHARRETDVASITIWLRDSPGAVMQTARRSRTAHVVRRVRCIAEGSPRGAHRILRCTLHGRARKTWDRARQGELKATYSAGKHPAQTDQRCSRTFRAPIQVVATVHPVRTYITTALRFF